MEVITHSPQETFKLGQKLAKKLSGGEILALFGDLGSGKTTFIQGLARGLGIEKRVLSPTFVFLRSYPAKIDQKKLIFNHVDLYRVTGEEDLYTIGLEYFLPKKETITAIEWAEKVERHLPKGFKKIYFLVIGENERKIRFDD